MKANSQQPTLEVRRQMIEQRRDNFRAQGFDAELEISTLEIQETASPEEQQEKQKAIDVLRGKVRNCYKSAEHLSGLIAQLPKPKAEKK